MGPARAELRRRWRATAVLAVLVGLVGWVALFGVAGYRRSVSALDRFVAYSRPPVPSSPASPPSASRPPCRWRGRRSGVTALLTLEGARDEIALGPQTMEQLDAQRGDRIEVTFEAMEALFGELSAAAFLVDYADGVAPGEALVALTDRGKTVLRVLPPDQVENLRRVALPLVFAGLLAVGAVVTLAHTLLAATRHWRRDLATLKALGFVPRQVWATMASQAATLVVVALAVGLPLRVALGGGGWRALRAE